MANVFPKWANRLPLQILIGLAVVVTLIIGGITYYFTPKYTRVGYQPTQPVAFSHALHAGQLQMDCRYCHTYVDRSAHSNVPTSATCMNCHNQVLPDSEQLQLVRNSYNTGESIPWVRIHKVPDYVYFNHAAHVNRGVSCVSCHGQINQMEVVSHDQPMSMGWCLDCHRNPEANIRPLEQVYNLDWEYPSAERQVETGAQLVHDWKVAPPQSCSGCHR